MVQYRLFIAATREALEAATKGIGSVVARFEEALSAGQIDEGRFDLVSVATAPALYRFVVLEQLTGAQVLAPWPRVEAWARALAARDSVRTTVAEDFPAELRKLLVERDSYLLR